MAVKIIAVVIGVIAVLLTFRVKWVLKTFFKTDEPSLDMQLKVKYTALALAVIAFITVFAFAR